MNAEEKKLVKKALKDDNKWKIVLDDYGFVSGIRKGNIVILQLNPGSCRNELSAIEIVKLLNEHLTKSNHKKSKLKKVSK